MSSSSQLTAVERFRARQKAIKQGVDPDLVAPKQKTGRPPSANPDSHALSQRRHHLRKEAAKLEIAIDIPKLKPGRPPSTMNSLYNILTGTQPLTEEEKEDAEVRQMLLEEQKQMAKEQELEKQESDRRMLDAQTANVEARAANVQAQAALEREKSTLEREKSAQESARARYQRQESFSGNLKQYIQHSAKKKKRAEQEEDAKPQAIVIQPSPLRPSPNNLNYETRTTRRSAAKPPISAKKAKRSAAKKTPAKKKPQVDIDFTEKKDILEKTTVELVWSLDRTVFLRLSNPLGNLACCKIAPSLANATSLVATSFVRFASV